METIYEETCLLNIRDTSAEVIEHSQSLMDPTISIQNNNQIINKPLKVIFCIPGRSFNGSFLKAWSELLMACVHNNILPILSNSYSSVVHYARSKCLGCDVSGGSNQKPFHSEIDYDYIMWIDSDIVFTPKDFFELLSSPHSVTCGYYMMEGGRYVATVKDWDNDYFRKNKTFRFLTIDDINVESKTNRYIPVSYSGMGWMLINKTAIESLEYPYFCHPLIKIDNMIDMCSEDVAFCRNLAQKGYQIMLDTKIRVGHCKEVVI